MAEVKPGTKSCDVYGDSLMAEPCVIQISKAGRETFVCSKDLSQKAYDRLATGIMRLVGPFTSRKRRGESDA